MNDGDLLQYTDVGCHLSERDNERLEQYFAMTAPSTTGILAFQAKWPGAGGPLNHDGQPLFDQPVYRWAKGDLLEYFDYQNNTLITNSKVIGRGIIFFKKCSKSIIIVSKWISVFFHSFGFIEDSPSFNKSLDGFIEHRHDQVILLYCALSMEWTQYQHTSTGIQSRGRRHRMENSWKQTGVPYKIFQFMPGATSILV